MSETPLADLGLLLDQLRSRGIVVGAPELQRLHTVFTHNPDLSHDALRDLLCHLLAKDAHQRHVIRSNFGRLVPRDFNTTTIPETAPQHWQLPVPQTAGAENNTEKAPPPPKPPLNFARISLLLFITSLLLVISLFLFDSPDKHNDGGNTPGPQTSDTNQRATDTTTTDKPIQSTLKLTPTIELWTATVKPAKERDRWQMLLPALLLLLGTGTGFVVLLYKTQRVTRQQLPERPKTPRGEGRSGLPGMKDQPFKLLSGQERRAMAWGIGQRFNELPRRQLDIPRTVSLSAKRAMPQIVLQSSRTTREVWLWRERFSHNPDLLQLADEISRTLSTANIVVHDAYFRGLPKQLTDESGKIIRDVEPLRQQLNPILLVFLDTEQLTRYQQSQPLITDQVLRQLGRWPNTMAVDAGLKPGHLAAHLKPYGLSCLLADAVPQWLIQQSGTPRENPQQQTQLMQWAIACALPARVVLEDEARALHDELGLAVNWHYATLQHYNTRQQEELVFGQNRIPLLNQFAHYIAGDSQWAYTALNFWAGRYEGIDKQLTAKETQHKQWKATHEQQRQVGLRQALLQLWGTPETVKKAATRLYNLHAHEKLRDDVERALSSYRFENQSDTPTDEQRIITLPHSWDKLGIETQRQFIACGLGQPAKALDTHADHFTRRLLGMLSGLALVGLVGSLYAVYPRSAAFQLQANSAQLPANAPVTQDWTENRQDYVVGSVKSMLQSAQGIETDHQVPLFWERTVVRAQQPLADNEQTQLWRLGTRAKPIRPDEVDDKAWPQWSIAVIEGDAQQAILQRLAAKLLDTGTADQVILGEKWRKKHDSLTVAAAGLDTQWLYIGVTHKPEFYTHPSKHITQFKDAGKLLEQLDKTDAIMKASAIGGVSLDSGTNPVWLKGERTYPTQAEILLPDNLKLLRIPAGSFQMGSDKGADDEKPVHTVTFPNDFYMGQTEVTFAQYDAYIAAQQLKDSTPERPDDRGWGRDNRPVINVSWDDTQGYVNWLTESQQSVLQGLQCRLPSEAEWEYTARAGSTTAYFWGDEIGKNKANCRNCSSEWDSEKTAPVGSFTANDWGLQDMSGNVYEWVQDRWHSNYQDAPVDGSVWESGESSSRVLRGGSWGNSSGYLRSADRFSLNPDDRDFFIGFRVVCAPPSVR